MQHILGVTPSETNMGDLRHTPTATRSHLKSQARPSPWPESGCPTLGSLPACSLPGCSHAAPPARDRSSLRHLPPSCPNLCGADFNKPFVGSKNDQRLGVVSVDSARVKCAGFQCPFNFRATQAERKYKQHFGYNSSVLHIIITTQNPTTHQKSTASDGGVGPSFQPQPRRNKYTNQNQTLVQDLALLRKCPFDFAMLCQQLKYVQFKLKSGVTQNQN